MGEKSAQQKQCSKAGAIIFLVLSFFLPSTASAQSCRWGSSVEFPPSAVSLRSYRDFFHAPGRLAVDSSGNVYTTDPQAGQVFIRDQYGRLINVLEGFNLPLGIAVDNAGRIYVGEQGRGGVTVFDQQWNLLNVFGQGDGEFVIPNDITVDPQSGWIYVSNSGAHTIKVYSADGALLSTFGGKGSGPGQFDFPAGIYMSPIGELFVADQNNDRIQVLDRNGSFLRCIGGGGAFSFSHKFGRIQGLTGDSQGRLYVADAFQGYVQVLDRFGYRLSTIGSFGEGPGKLRTPMDIVIDHHNRLFVASANSSRVEIFGLDSYLDFPLITAVVDVDPNTLNRSSRRNWITAYIEFRDRPVDQVNLATVNIFGVPAMPSPATIGDHDGNGIPDLMVKFDAQALLSMLPDGQAPVVIAGELADGTPFEGSATVRVLPDEEPHSGSQNGKAKGGGK